VFHKIFNRTASAKTARMRGENAMATPIFRKGAFIEVEIYSISSVLHYSHILQILFLLHNLARNTSGKGMPKLGADSYIPL
jgi:hypothetical protein